MLQFKIYSKEGNIIGEHSLPEGLFGVEPNDAVIYEAVRMYQMNKRHGNADTKTRANVRGGGKKPWVQKHTGRARAGSTRSPLWPGGGTVFGPHPKDYYYRVPKKKLILAFKSALSYKAKSGKILLFDKFELPESKTKLFADMLKAVGFDRKKTILFVCQKKDTGFYRAGKNAKNVDFSSANSLNTLEVAGADTLAFSLDSLSELVSIHQKS